MSHIKLFLDSHQDKYYPGSTINGRLYCYFRSEKTIRAISLEVIGKEETGWTGTATHYNTATKRNETRNIHYTGEHLFLKHDIVLFGGRGEETLPAGSYSYPFTYILPSPLPSSFSGSYGSIEYKIKGKVDRAWKTDFNTVEHVNVFSPIYLSSLGFDINHPFFLTDEKYVCCCCCKSGPLSLRVKVPGKGFSVGQVVLLEVDIQNLTNLTVEEVRYKLKREIEYHVHTPSRQEKVENDTVARVTSGAIGAHSENQFIQDFCIPHQLVIPNFQNCTLMSVKYLLEIEAAVSGCHTNLSISAYVHISNVDNSQSANPVLPPVYTPQQPYAPNVPYPLVDIPQPHYPANIGFTVEASSSGEKPPTAPQGFTNPQADPPSYEAAMGKAPY